jgi:hypothetical protein
VNITILSGFLELRKVLQIEPYNSWIQIKLHLLQPAW